MTDELDPQTQQHIDNSADTIDDCDTSTRSDGGIDAAVEEAPAAADEAADANVAAEQDKEEQLEQPDPSDTEPKAENAPQAAGPIEVSSEEELDAVMDSMMDAVKAMKDAVADADVDAEEEEAAEAASTFVPGETPVADQGSTMPSFLQLEHPTIGTDAVDPHAAGFSVIEGGTGNIAAPQATDADAADTARPTAPHSPAASRDLGTAVSNTANAVGTFIAQGASAMREMNAAKKALADARAHLSELEQRIADQAEELETRQDIAGRYDQIIADQRQAIATAQKTAAAAEIDRDAHAAKATELKGQLEQMKAEDDATELRLKAALDAVEAREASSRETGNRLVRRLEDSKRIRDKVKAERDTGVAAARQTADATRAQLETLRREYAELQRNPSANPANYTVRTSELSMQISDAADALRKAEEDIPRVTADLEHSLAAAEQAVEQAQAPIADAKRAHQAVTTEADAARDELQTAKTAAATRQRELREKIATEDKARRDQEQTIANAQADAAHAQSIIEQATEVHDHPEITESLAGSLARDKAEHAETEREVAQLEATEDDVRERTRDSRIKFTGAIVCIVAAILAIILVWLFASK
ncbi:hypothetical protein [Collinsella sp. AM33-4BH]|uniref:hypothetical protein n=1 Tax=Collinsella sp. AM33-4BH TaxID=2292315 RepID=UPI000E4CA43D|nr:hypothetical protein [Collinsella sp. AM33-4BH]RHC97202.1 hypothetical protein DW821_01225 [Collinsella sp. AM33-4BH]